MKSTCNTTTAIPRAAPSPVPSSVASWAAYDVGVQFQDGAQRIFRFPDYAPFRPGEHVVQNPQGLARS